MMGNKDELYQNRNEDLREIFLFSNGQQDSPPRKHSVSVSEPWPATLTRISTAQQGSTHIIELYSISGKKIEGPQELSNGAAYVAVEPPQAFVPAGYHDYLMKASRSREKRQERIPERNVSLKPVKINSMEKLREETEEATYIEINQGAILLPTSVVVEKTQNGITDKVPQDTLTNLKAIKRTSILKPIQNRRSSESHRNSFITRNITNNYVAPVNKKKRHASNIDAIKNKFETPLTNGTETIIAPPKSNSMVAKFAQMMFKGDEAVNTRQASHNREHTESNDLQNDMVIENLSNKNITRLYAQRNLTLDSSRNSPSSVIEQNAPETDTYGKSQRDSEYVDLHLQNPSVVGLIDDSFLSRSQREADYKEVRNTENNLNTRSNVLNEFSQTKTILLGSQGGAAENNLTINVKHGNMVNVKLDIQFKYRSNSVVETTRNNNEKTMTSIVNTPKSDLPTQDIEVAATKNRQEAPTLTEVELSFEQMHHMTNHLKAAVYQYHCCSSSGNPEPFVLVNVNNNDTGFILLPVRKQNENPERSNSELEINHHNKGKVQEDQVLTRTKNNIVQSDEINVIPDVSQKDNPIQSKARPRNNTKHSDENKIVPELPEQANPTQSKQSTRDNTVQLDEITMVPDVSEKDYLIQPIIRTRDNTKQSVEMKITPELPDQGSSTESRSGTRANTAQVDEITIVSDIGEQCNPIQSKSKTRDTKQFDEIMIVPELPDHQVNYIQSRPRTRDNTAQSDGIKIIPDAPEQNNDLMPKDQWKRVNIVEENKMCNCCETCTSHKQITACSCGQIRLLTRPACDYEQPITTSSVFDQHRNAPVTNVSSFQDAFTQTVWSGTVLEARPRGDGGYDFHMPALETLKRYNAL